MHAAGFSELNDIQRLTLFTFALLTQSIQVFRKEVVAEGIFDYLHTAYTTPQDLGDIPRIPLIHLLGEDEDRTLNAILAADGSVAPIRPHESECSPFVLGELGIPIQDRNPYTILHSLRYGEWQEDGPRRLLIVGVLSPEQADYYGTEPALVLLDFDFGEEHAPVFHELPFELGQPLAYLLPKFFGKEMPELGLTLSGSK